MNLFPVTSNVDALFSSVFLTLSLASVAFITATTMSLARQTIYEVALCVFSDKIIGLFFTALVVMAFVFLFKWQFIYTTFSLILLASVSAASLSWMSKRAIRILVARGWYGV